MKKSLLSCFLVMVTALVLAWTGLAQANTIVDLNFNRVENAASVNVHMANLGDVSVWAGDYILNVRTPSGSGNPFIETKSFCVESSWAPESTMPYEVIGPITSGALKMVAYLQKTYSGTPMAAAAGVAGWEAVNDFRNGIPFDLGSGNFILYGGVSTADVTTAFNAALKAVYTDGFNAEGYVLFHNPVGNGQTVSGYQDFISCPVPLPPSVLLMGTGILGLVAVGWRRRMTAQG